MTFASWFRTLGRNIEQAAVGVVHEAGHIVDEGFSTVRALGNDVVKVAHEGSTAVTGVASSLAMPIALAAGAVGLAFLLKR